MTKNKSIVVVLGIIENEKGEILLSLRNDPQFKGAHLKWDFIGGKNEFGESLEETLKRETLEETGLEIEIIRMLPGSICKNWVLEKSLQHTLLFCYHCKLVSGEMKNNDKKINQLLWVEPKKSLEMDLLFSVEKFLKIFLSLPK